MAVNPINTQIPVPQGDPAAAVRHRSHQAWMETVPGAGQLSRKDRNAIILATLANPGSRALPGVGEPTASAVAALTNADTLALANLNNPAETLAALANPASLAVAGLGAATPGVLAALADPGSLALADLASAAPAPAAAADPDLTTALTSVDSALGSTAVLNAVNVAAQDAAAAARDAAATTAQAAQAVSAAADAVSAALAAANAAAGVPAPPDPSGLATDATAKYLGAGFIGLPPVPGAQAAALPEGVPAVDGVLATPSLAGNTYSNPHDRAFGQSAAHQAQSAPMAPTPAEAPELDLEG